MSNKVRERAIALAKKHDIKNYEKLTNQEIFDLVKDKTGVKQAAAETPKSVEVLPPEKKPGEVRQYGSQTLIQVQPAPAMLLPTTAPFSTDSKLYAAWAVLTAIGRWLQPYLLGVSTGLGLAFLFGRGII